MSPERRVFTYFYYWYEPTSAEPGERQEASDSRTLHDPPGRPADWRSVDWHKGQLLDMRRAGVDVALAAYWGDGLHPTTAWSTGGLEVLAAALEQLEAEGEAYPAIGLFFDTYILQGADLTDPKTSTWLLDQLLGFYRRVPGRFLATQDGRPIIWLYHSDFASDFDPETFERLGKALEGELGARPFWVAEESWSYATSTDGAGRRSMDPERPMPFDAFYRWGGAFAGALLVQEPLRVASVGPGYDDRAVVGRTGTFDRQRESGCYYARAWRDAQALDAHWVVIETWNELYEGSGVAETAEWGRIYVDATATYVGAFKHRVPIVLPRGCPASPPGAVGWPGRRGYDGGRGERLLSAAPFARLPNHAAGRAALSYLARLS